jgi:hypothetical protein
VDYVRRKDGVKEGKQVDQASTSSEFRINFDTTPCRVLWRMGVKVVAGWLSTYSVYRRIAKFFTRASRQFSTR